ncbi:MAG: hypothetical protein OXC62_03170 [Aestuariivita sp.]|nr:hypothetical protein [Aestuariivita sp.]
MAKGLQIAEPPRRRSEAVAEEPKAEATKAKPKVARESGVMFTQVAEGEKVQFNKRIKRGVADGYEMLAIRTRKKVPDLLEEALALLEEKYGKV